MAEEDATRWDARYRGRSLPTPGPSVALQRVASWIPSQGRMLDVAGGDGAQAVWLATQGLEVTLCDVSGVALGRAKQVAEANEVCLTTRMLDLETAPLPDGPWSAVLCSNYFQPSLWSAVADALAPGGVAIWLHPTATNMTRHEKPSRRFLLERGQGRTLFANAGLTVLLAEEAWIGDRHLSCVVGTVGP
ncbi:MAG: class I SAM-dependent methyltransferase [Nannocystaceae bacterium]|nr:class I SAM-dependent methyltransferase [Nannocystaceae bacterium]